MKVKQLFTDDDAVSPVIGVILMVAITVILAAVIGAFVLDIGGSQESAPQVQWDWSDNSTDFGGVEGNVTVTHGGGDTINNPGQISVSADGNSTTDMTLADWHSTWSANDDARIVIESETTGTATLTWSSSDGSQSTELSNHDFDVSG